MIPPALLLLLLVGPPPAVDPPEVHLVLSEDAGLYRDTESALRAELGPGVRIASVVLAEGWSAPEQGLVVAIGTRAAARCAETMPEGSPLVYCWVTHPQEVGLADRPRTYGVSAQIPLEDQLEVLADALPRASRIGVVYRPGGPSERTLEQLRGLSGERFEIVSVAVEKKEEFAKGMKTLLAKGPDVLWVAPDPGLLDRNTLRSLLLSGIRKGVPAFAYSSAIVKAGAIVGVTVSPEDQGVAAARHVSTLLAKESESWPAEKHETARLRIALNLVGASSLGISIPSEIIARATFVVRKR